MICCRKQAWSASAGMGGTRSAVSNAQLQQLKEMLQQQNSGAIPLNFVPTAPGHDPSTPNPKGRMPRQSPRNPQTERFLEMLGLPYNLDQQSRQFVPPSESLLCAQYSICSGKLWKCLEEGVYVWQHCTTKRCWALLL